MKLQSYVIDGSLWRWIEAFLQKLPNKCEVLTVKNKVSPDNRQYAVLDSHWKIFLENVIDEKELGTEVW
jgi:hypothetical protein